MDHEHLHGHQAVGVGAADRQIHMQTTDEIMRKKDKDFRILDAKLQRLEQRYVDVVRQNRLLQRDKKVLVLFLQELGVLSLQDETFQLNEKLQGLREWIQRLVQDKKTLELLVHMIFPNDVELTRMCNDVSQAVDFDVLRNSWIAYEELYSQGTVAVQAAARESIMMCERKVEEIAEDKAKAEVVLRRSQLEVQRLTREKAQLLASHLQYLQQGNLGLTTAPPSLSSPSRHAAVASGIFGSGGRNVGEFGTGGTVPSSAAASRDPNASRGSPQLSRGPTGSEQFLSDVNNVSIADPATPSAGLPPAETTGFAVGTGSSSQIAHGPHSDTDVGGKEVSGRDDFFVSPSISPRRFPVGYSSEGSRAGAEETLAAHRAGDSHRSAPSGGLHGAVGRQLQRGTSRARGGLSSVSVPPGVHTPRHHQYTPHQYPLPRVYRHSQTVPHTPTCKDHTPLDVSHTTAAQPDSFHRRRYTGEHHTPPPLSKASTQPHATTLASEVPNGTTTAVETNKTAAYSSGTDTTENDRYHSPMACEDYLPLSDDHLDAKVMPQEEDMSDGTAALHAMSPATRRDTSESMRMQLSNLKMQKDKLQKDLEASRSQAKEMLRAKDFAVEKLRARLITLEQSDSTEDFLQKWAEKQANRDMQIVELQAKIGDMHKALVEADYLVECERRQGKVLKDNIRDLERSNSRQHVNQDYLKNVIVQYIEFVRKGDPAAESLLPVICRVLSLDPGERQRVTAIPNVFSKATAGLRFSGFM